jgi:hypothetical protein
LVTPARIASTSPARASIMSVLAEYVAAAAAALVTASASAAR